MSVAQDTFAESVAMGSSIGTALNVAELGPRCRLSAEHLKKQHGGILTVGIYKGTFFDEVLRLHSDCGDWAGAPAFCFGHPPTPRYEWPLKHAASTDEQTNPPAELRQPGDGMQAFAEYVSEVRRENEKKEREQRTQSVPTDEKKNCCVCLSRPAACAFVPCGHLVTCRPCADAVHTAGCPICRAEVYMVLDIFV